MTTASLPSSRKVSSILRSSDWPEGYQEPAWEQSRQYVAMTRVLCNEQDLYDEEEELDELEPEPESEPDLELEPEPEPDLEPEPEAEPESASIGCASTSSEEEEESLSFLLLENGEGSLKPLKPPKRGELDGTVSWFR